MMIRLFYLRLLLALGFVLGQSFALAHATQHELDGQAKSVACEICAVGHAGGGLPTVAPKLPSLQPVAEAPLRLAPQPLAHGFRFTPLSRGPPAVLS